MPRHSKPGAKTPSERAKESAARRQIRMVGLPPEAIAHADAIQQRDGDANRTAAITRVLREAAGGRRCS